jgi:acyl-coenzyme A synthetase/AMP-(fatty) acid ligase
VEAAAPYFRSGCSAAFSVLREGEERVVVAVELDPRADVTHESLQALERVARNAVWQGHGLALERVVPIAAGTLPKTTSGKIQRLACRKAFETGILQRVGLVPQAEE